MKLNLFIILTILLLFTPIVSAQVVNGYFTDGLNNWSSTGDGATQWSEFGGESASDPAVRLITSFVKDVEEEKTQTMSQSVNVTGYEHLIFSMNGAMFELPASNDGYGKVTIGSSTPVYIGNQNWQSYEVDIIGSGIQTLEFELYHWDLASINYNHDAQIWIDYVQLSDQYLFTLSGYINNTEGNPVFTYPYLNNSDSTESDDVTGYYEFTGLTEGSYLLSIDGFVYDDYSAVIDISSDTEHNITLSRQLPILSTTNINPGKNKMLLTWVRNVVVSDVLIYKGTNTNQIASVSSGSYLTGYYQNENLDCESPYTYWLQPMDNAIAGPKYELSDTTTDCETPDVFIPLPPSIPTPPIYEEDANETIIDEIIEIITELLPEPLKELPEKLVEIIEETITYISTPFNWILLITAYIGAFIGKSIFNNDEDYAEIITSTLLYGTIGWIIILLINFFVPIISLNEIISILIFTTSGFIIAAIASSIQSETKIQTPRRPRT